MRLKVFYVQRRSDGSFIRARPPRATRGAAAASPKESGRVFWIQMRERERDTECDVLRARRRGLRQRSHRPFIAALLSAEAYLAPFVSFPPALVCWFR